MSNSKEMVLSSQHVLYIDLYIDLYIVIRFSKISDIISLGTYCI